MATGVLILGNTGTGKSTSLRNFKRGEVAIANVANKPLPFRSSLQQLRGCTYDDIKAYLRKPRTNAFVIDDAGYLLQFENFSRATERGWDKFNEMGRDFYLLLEAIRFAPEDLIVYVMAHLDTDENGISHMKTVGKALNNQLCVEGLFSIVFQTTKDESGYWFITNSTTHTCPAKSPIDMFSEERVENDLKKVDTTIRKFYGLRALDDVRPLKNPVKEKQVEAPKVARVEETK